MVEGEHSEGKPQDYVCGFMFGLRSPRVVLIHKNRPPWQAGKLNGVGGKIEGDEEPKHAMVREFREEAGFHFEGWRLFCTIELSRGGRIYCYTASTDLFGQAETRTDEEIETFHLGEISDLNTMPNVQWLIPMALSFLHGEKSRSFVVKEVE